MILFGYTNNWGILLGNRESRYEPWGSSMAGVGSGEVGVWFSSWYVVSIDTGHIAQSPQSGPRWSPAFKMEPVLSVSSFTLTFLCFRCSIYKMEILLTHLPSRAVVRNKWVNMSKGQETTWQSQILIIVKKSHLKNKIHGIIQLKKDMEQSLACGKCLT